MYEFFAFVGSLSVILSGVVVLATPAIMAVRYDWKFAYLYVVIAAVSLIAERIYLAYLKKEVNHEDDRE